MTAIDLASKTDDELDQLRVDVITEQERRDKLKTLPDAVMRTAEQYVDAGGDRQVLVDVVTTGTVPDDDEAGA